MIILSKIQLVYVNNILNDIKSRKIKVVSMAQNGLKHLNLYANLYLKIPKDV
jgi:D-arabinose 5-phosphate isomerase GutQ